MQMTNDSVESQMPLTLVSMRAQAYAYVCVCVCVCVHACNYRLLATLLVRGFCTST